MHRLFSAVLKTCILHSRHQHVHLNVSGRFYQCKLLSGHMSLSGHFQLIPVFNVPKTYTKCIMRVYLHLQAGTLKQKIKLALK